MPAGEDEEGAQGPDRASGAVSAAWTVGLALYALEVVVVGFFSVLFGGLSAMLSDTCFTGSTELICEPRWQTVLALTPITALVLTVAAMAVLVWRARQPWSLVTAFVATPLVPLVAFLVMQAVVTA